MSIYFAFSRIVLVAWTQEKQALPKERMCVEIFTDDSMGIFLLDMVVCVAIWYIRFQEGSG